MFRIVVFSLGTVLILAMSPVAAAEKVALRAANGRFLRASDDGAIRADSFFLLDKEIFELVSRGQHEVALQGPGGRYLVPG
jgi:hypothetical protein